MKRNNNNYEEFFFSFPEDENEPIEKEELPSQTIEEAEPQELYSLSDFAGKGRFQKKKKGLYNKFINWWKPLKKSQKSLVITAVSLFLVFSILLGVSLPFLRYNYNKIETDELGIENVIDKDIINIALFGIDTRNTKSFKGNSDSIMILSLNTNTKKVKIISIMRDTFVPITYNGKTSYRKINYAYSKGGPELAIKTLNQNFGLDISEYATVNFFGMVDIIDAVGGIDAELTEAEVRPKNKYIYGLNGCVAEICKQLGANEKENYITTAGKHHLNGIQAVAYSRIRKVANIWGTNNDYGRTDRQRYVMEQLFNKAITLEKKNYMKLAKSLIPCSETSLSYSEILGLAFDILLKSPKFEQARVPTEEYTMSAPKTSAGSVVYFDLAFASKLIHSFIYQDVTPEDYIEANGVEKNDWYANRGSSNKPSTSTSKPSTTTSSESDTSGSTDKTPSSTSKPSSSKPESSSSEKEPTGSEPSGNDSQNNGDNNGNSGNGTNDGNNEGESGNGGNTGANGNDGNSGNSGNSGNDENTGNDGKPGADGGAVDGGNQGGTDGGNTGTDGGAGDSGTGDSGNTGNDSGTGDGGNTTTPDTPTTPQPPQDSQNQGNSN